MLGSAPRVLGQVTGNESDLAPVTSMDTGSFHTVVIIRDSGVNVVKDWGANGKGQVRTDSQIGALRLLHRRVQR